MANGLFNLKQQLQGLIRGAWSGTSSSNAPKYIEYLVVAGGGGGGSGYGSGAGSGGGAGGLLQGILPINLGTSYTVTVGSGGSGATSSANSSASNGLNSSFGSITALGGGGGLSPTASAIGNAGGSGGGAMNTFSGGSGTSGQGNAGGRSTGTTDLEAGGGGGAGTIGLNSIDGSRVGANGGAGIASSISGTVTSYAGGGGGAGAAASSIGGQGGVGGGGGGYGVATSYFANGGTNTGGGGGGHGNNGNVGANGGSGIVIVRYSGSTQYFSGGTVTIANGFVIHTFITGGTLVPLSTPVLNGPTNFLINSLRFRSSNSAYLNRTVSVAGNLQTWTLSAWVKRGTLTSGYNAFFSVGSNNFNVRFNATTDCLEFYNFVSSAFQLQFITTQIFRDPSAWYHIIIAMDTTQATSTNRTKLYINGLQVTSFSTATYPAQNTNTVVNSATGHYLGENNSVGSYFDGYMTEINFIDGQQLTPSSFGYNDLVTGVWQPMVYVGTYGTNGFHLTFTNTTSTTTLGYDSSSNGNNWTPSGISLTTGSTYDSMTDSPTLTSATNSNYAVLNPLDAGSGATISNGNLGMSCPTGTYNAVRSTVQMNSGKWYWEATLVVSNGSGYENLGIANPTFALNGGSAYVGASGSYGYQNDGAKYANGTITTGYGATFTSGDVIGVAFDATGGSLTFYKNNTSQGVAFTGITSGLYFPAISGYGSTWAMNFGQQGFKYTPPSGYVALNTYNLPTPAVPNGRLYMDATTYTGTGSARSVYNAATFQPDLVWAKGRSVTYDNELYDTVRGATKRIISNSTGAEATVSGVTAFNSNGFSLGSDTGTNQASATYVAWQWQAGQGTFGPNTNGSVTSVVSSNTTAGFSIVSWTPSAGNDTVGHGLGVAPSMIIAKPRAISSAWPVYHSALGANLLVTLNTTSLASSGTTTWYNTTPTSTVFYTGSWFSSSGATIAYCFAQIAGFSAFGSYAGNASGSTGSQFIYTGFQPKWVLIKVYAPSGGGSWTLFDTTRSPYNTEILRLQPNSSNAEASTSPEGINALSNGFQLVGDFNFGDTNETGYTYIYAAFASNPFKYANAF